MYPEGLCAFTKRVGRDTVNLETGNVAAVCHSLQCECGVRLEALKDLLGELDSFLESAFESFDEVERDGGVRPGLGQAASVQTSLVVEVVEELSGAGEDRP